MTGCIYYAPGTAYRRIGASTKSRGNRAGMRKGRGTRRIEIERVYHGKSDKLGLAMPRELV